MDAIELEVMVHALAGIAEEMLARLVRAAYSSNIKERRDCSTALLTGGAAWWRRRRRSRCTWGRLEMRWRRCGRWLLGQGNLAVERPVCGRLAPAGSDPRDGNRLAG